MTLGGNITVQLVDQSGTEYSGASVTLPAGISYYDQPLALPITLTSGRIVRAKITAVDLGVAADLIVNLIGATAQGGNAPAGCCPPSECQQPTAQLLFFKGNVTQEVAEAQAAAAAAAASAAAASTSATAAAASATASAGSAAASAASASAAAAEVVQAAAWATNANNAATAAGVYAGQAAASAAAAAASATLAQAGPMSCSLQLSVAAVKTIATATPTAVIWDAILFDDLAFWEAGSPTRITIPAGSGIERVRLTAGIRWTANATGERKISIRSNPVGIHAANSIWATDDRPSDDTGDGTVSTGIITVEEGMYFEVLVEQDSGGDLDLNTATAPVNAANFFSIEVIKRTV